MTFHAVLPVPPSANRYWRTTRNGRVYKTNRAIAYSWEVVAAVDERDPFAGPVSIAIDVYRPRKRGDLDNYLKVLFDALEGIAYENDRQIVEINARRFDDKHNPRVVVTVRKLKESSA